MFQARCSLTELHNYNYDICLKMEPDLNNINDKENVRSDSNIRHVIIYIRA